jgi:hypothetical protein
MPSAIGPDRFNEMLADPDVIKFAFVRETIPRLASAYASKFMRNSKQKQRFNTLVGRDHNADVSFDEFIHHVYANPAAQDSDEHWRLQSKQLSWGIVPFSFIGRFERFEADARRLLTMLFPDRDAPIFDVRAAFHANKSPSMKYAAAVQPEQAAMILTAYAPDEEMLAEIAKSEQQTS